VEEKIPILNVKRISRKNTGIERRKSLNPKLAGPEKKGKEREEKTTEGEKRRIICSPENRDTKCQ